MNLREKAVQNNWQFRIDQTLSDHRVSSINSWAGHWKLHKSLMGHPMFKVLRQLVTGHHNLKACSSKITGGSPTCKCGQLETLEHFLYFCERYSRSRYEWTMNVSDILKTSSVPLRSVSWDILFGQQKD